MKFNRTYQRFREAFDPWPKTGTRAKSVQEMVERVRKFAEWELTVEWKDEVTLAEARDILSWSDEKITAHAQKVWDYRSQVKESTAPSEKQVAYLRSRGVQVPKTKQECSRLINRLRSST